MRKPDRICMRPTPALEQCDETRPTQPQGSSAFGKTLGEVFRYLRPTRIYQCRVVPITQKWFPLRRYKKASMQHRVESTCLSSAHDEWTLQPVK